jgi:hypothetical protein
VATQEQLPHARIASSTGNLALLCDPQGEADQLVDEQDVVALDLLLHGPGRLTMASSFASSLGNHSLGSSPLEFPRLGKEDLLTEWASEGARNRARPVLLAGPRLFQRQDRRTRAQPKTPRPHRRTVEGCGWCRDDVQGGLRHGAPSVRGGPGCRRPAEAFSFLFLAARCPAAISRLEVAVAVDAGKDVLG